MEIQKITLPVAILLAAIVLAIAFYAVQYNKQQSIERQQILKIKQDCNEKTFEEYPEKGFRASSYYNRCISTIKEF